MISWSRTTFDTNDKLAQSFAGTTAFSRAVVGKHPYRSDSKKGGGGTSQLENYNEEDEFEVPSDWNDDTGSPDLNNACSQLTSTNNNTSQNRQLTCTHRLRHFLTRDRVLVKWVAYCYIIIILLQSITMDLRSLVAKTSTFRENSVRRHHIFLCTCMTIAIVLYVFQLVQIILHRRQNSTQLETRRLIVPHIMVLLGILCAFSITFYIWKIIQTAFRNHCVVENLSFNTQIQLSTRLAEYFFDSIAIIYLTVQGIWLVTTSYYRFSSINIGAMFYLTVCQAFTTNAALYFDITVKEAAHTFQQAEMRFKLEDNETAIRCDTQGNWPWLEHFYDVNIDYVEPLGYAGVIECLVLFAILLTTITHEVVELGKDPQQSPSSAMEHAQYIQLQQLNSSRGDTKSNHSLLSTSQTRTIINGTDSNTTESFLIMTSFNKDNRTKLWVGFSHTTGMLLAIGLIICNCCLAVIFCDQTFSGNKVYDDEYSKFLRVRISAFCIINILFILSMIYQRRDKNIRAMHSSHVKLDLRLLNIAALAPVTYSFFLLQSCGDENTVSPSQLRTLQTIDSINIVLQVLLQVVFFRRAICYETGLSLRPHNNMPRRLDWLVETMTILLATIFNTQIWTIQLFTRKNLPMADPTARDYYPPLFWACMREFTYPLMIFFRFHSFAIGLNLLRSHYNGYVAARAIGVTWRQIIIPPTV